MGRTRILSGLVAFTAAMTMACTSSPRPVSAGPAPTTAGTTTTPATSSSPPPPPAQIKAVPIDQVPPGNPDQWVPKGVANKGKYQQHGDHVPYFSPTMFSNDQDGAIAMAQYYLAAQNWSLALNDNRPVDVVCVAPRCHQTSKKFSKLRALKEHIVGGRIHAADPAIKLATIADKSKWLYQVNVTTDSYRVVESGGATVDSYRAHKNVPTNIFLRWTGKMWSIALQTTHR